MIRMISVTGKSMKNYDAAADNAVNTLIHQGEKVHYYRETMRTTTKHKNQSEYEVVLNVAIQI